MNEKVILLAHRNDKALTSSHETLACGNCKNKAWTVLYEANGDGFPRLACTCCGWDGGHFGWVDKRDSDGHSHVEHHPEGSRDEH